MDKSVRFLDLAPVQRHVELLDGGGRLARRLRRRFGLGCLLRRPRLSRFLRRAGLRRPIDPLDVLPAVAVQSEFEVALGRLPAPVPDGRRSDTDDRTVVVALEDGCLFNSKLDL